MADGLDVIWIKCVVLLLRKKRYLHFSASGLITDMYTLELISAYKTSI